MPYGSPSDPVGGTVITVAAYVSNSLDPIRWLRLMTGNADPPGSNYVVVSDSVSGTTWRKVPTDAIADKAITGGKVEDNFTFLTPPNYVGNPIWNDFNLPASTLARLNTVSNFTARPTYVGNPIAYVNLSDVLTIAGVTLSGALSAASAAISGALSATTVTFFGLLTVVGITGGSTATGTLQVKGLAVGSDGANIGAGGVTTTGAVNPASYTGGSTATGDPSVKGLNVGTDGIASAGPINPAQYQGGSTSSGTPSVHGLVVGSDGIASTGTMTIAGQEVYWPSNPPPLGTGAAVPSGLGGWVRQASEIATGWSRESNLDGRIPVGAGTTFSTTFTELTNYGSAWSFTPTDSGHSHSGASLGVSGHTDGENTDNGLGNGGGTSVPSVGHTHTQGTLDVAGATDSAAAVMTATTWTIPSRGVVWVRKN